MQRSSPNIASETFTVAEIAAAAGVSTTRVAQAIRASGLSVIGQRLGGADAVQLVRTLSRRSVSRANALPLTLMTSPRPRRAGPLAISLAAHVLFLALLVTAASLGMLNAPNSERIIPTSTPVHLVYLMDPGPGGGGGGGGLNMPAPAPKAEMKAAPKPKVHSPVPPAKKRPAPPTPVPPKPIPTPPVPHPKPVVVPPPAPPVPTPVVPVPAPAPPTPAPPTPAPPQPAPPAVVAPVLSAAADRSDRVGVPTNSTARPDGSGPGSGGGAGSGAGLGLGEGQGGGIGAGSGGGTGGGPLHPGAGIAPPQLLREVRANYTDEARKRAIEGDVVLEIVVKRDGSVGQVRVLHSLGGGLEQRAVDAVRQWKFAPATRYGAAVDVVVEAAVGFKLR